jgi:arginyl-tRNA synthetase
VLYTELDVIPFEKYYPESMTTPTGVETVQRELKNGVYEESDGAVVFKGEPYGLHTRVFINSAGLPTYETKDVGLIMQKWADYHFDQSFVITGNDIIEYMKVVQKSIEQFEPELVKRSRHLTHGNLKLSGGKKMSSRKGEVLLALDVLEAAKEAQTAMSGTFDRNIMLGAVKYAFLKTRIGSDVIYDPAESVSLTGNSGPYLQYAHARARRILEKATVSYALPTAVRAEDRLLVRKLGEYHEVIEHAAQLLEPHLVCTYLFELAQEFNRYYENNQVIGSEHEAHRCSLVATYADTLRAGLMVLGIDAPEKM